MARGSRSEGWIDPDMNCRLWPSKILGIGVNLRKSPPAKFLKSEFGARFRSKSLVLSQYTSITLPFQIVFNSGWPSMSLYIEKGLLKTNRSAKRKSLVS